MIKNQALGGRSNKALIFLGMFLGLVSAALVVVYLNRAGDDSGGGSGGVVTPVVVASQSIPIGTRVTEEMLTMKTIASDAVLAEAFRDTADVVGQVTKVPLVAGEQVIPTKVTATGTAIGGVDNPALAYVIPEGMRAVSVTVSSIIGASGLIRPGDFVDVILTAKIQNADTAVASGFILEGAKDEIARTVLQNAQVLSIGQDVARTVVSEGEDGAPVVADGSDPNPEAASVTLAVSPVEGEVLTVAETCGKNFSGRLALALRSFGDSSQVQTRSVWSPDGGPPTCGALLGLTSLQ